MIMKSASVLAKQCGLEQYLDEPAELNKTILNLMLLQETIQAEKFREKRGCQIISVKRAASGKFVAACCGDKRYRYAVETALKASTSTLVVFQRNRFVTILKSMGVPEDRITGFCDSIIIDDDTHCIDQE